MDIADRLILKFCKSVETLYGKHVITPNMHLHNHLKEVILDHGPVQAFGVSVSNAWYSIMGSTTTDKRSVELQLMRKLLISRQLKNTKTPDRYQGDFIDLCSPSGIADSDVTEEISQNWSVKHEFENIDCNTGTPSWYKLEK